MRQVLIEFARMRKAERRGGSQTTLSLDENVSAVTTENKDPESLVQIGILMDRLEKRNAETARIVDMHYFAGFTLDEIAEITGLTLRQVRHRWEFGRNWLKDGMRG